jgi:hypothetical protein
MFEMITSKITIHLNILSLLIKNKITRNLNITLLVIFNKSKIKKYFSF